jgi:hypothetical protein
MSAKDIQVGGSHYKSYSVQPIEFIQQNNLSYIQGCVIKYICRYKDKNGREDLEKIKHYIDLLIEQEYPQEQASEEAEWVTTFTGKDIMKAPDGEYVTDDGESIWLFTNIGRRFYGFSPDASVAWPLKDLDANKITMK